MIDWSSDSALGGGKYSDTLGLRSGVSSCKVTDSSLSGFFITLFFREIVETGWMLVSFEPTPEKLSSRASRY